MRIFWRLVLAHLLTDFTLQTNYIARWKRQNVWGGMAHALIFLFSAGALCYNYLTDIWVILGNNIIIYGWMAILILTIFHFLEDEWRVWTIQKWNSPDSFIFFAWDQVIHFVLIFIFAPQTEGLFPEKWVLLGTLFILTTHFSTILIYYIEKQFFGQAEMPVDKKYISMIERLAISFSLLLPGKWALSFIFVFVFSEVVHRQWKKNNFSWVNTVIGSVLAIIAGILARIIYY
ncbi:MAG: DUF3307 domain-containing protein [Endomicrobiales bacterium]|nr:DUF3307 domain-containing protein [Endomicrobiales bacterium]